MNQHNIAVSAIDDWLQTYRKIELITPAVEQAAENAVEAILRDAAKAAIRSALTALTFKTGS